MDAETGFTGFISPVSWYRSRTAQWLRLVLAVVALACGCFGLWTALHPVPSPLARLAACGHVYQVPAGYELVISAGPGQACTAHVERDG